MDQFHIVTRYDESNVRLRLQYAILKALDSGIIDEPIAKILQEKEKDIQFVGREVENVLFDVFDIIEKCRRNNNPEFNGFFPTPMNFFYQMMDIHHDGDERKAWEARERAKRIYSFHKMKKEEEEEFRELLRRGIDRMLKHGQINEPIAALAIEKTKEVEVVGRPAEDIFYEVVRSMDENVEKTGFKLEHCSLVSPLIPMTRVMNLYFYHDLKTEEEEKEFEKRHYAEKKKFGFTI